MDYNSIGNFLEKFKKLIASSEGVYSTIIDVVFKHTTFSLERKDITIKGSVIYIKSSPLLKSELFIRKQLILDEVNTLLSIKKFTDIK